MVDDARQSVQPDLAAVDHRMAILMGPQRIHAVVQMDRLQPLQADDAVELRQHAIQIIDDVVTCVVHMACVQADAHLVHEFHAIHDPLQFFKLAADFRAFSGHRLQQHRRPLIFKQNVVQHLDDEIDADIDALLHMAARMEVVHVAGHVFHPLQIVRHRVAREFADGRIRRTAVQRIGRMGQNLPEVVL